MSIIQLIPSSVRNMVPQRIRESINESLNHIGIYRQELAFLCHTKEKTEEKFRRAIVSSYESYSHIMHDKKILELPNDPDCFVIPRVIFSVSNKCSLRCKDCINLVPYFKDKRDIPVNKMIDYIDKFFSIVDRCICVEVIGGEPFLYKDLGIILKHLTNKAQIYSIELTTNGTCIPAEDLWEILKNEKIYISLSDYKFITSQKKNDFIKCMKEHAVNYRILDESLWVDAGGYQKRFKNTAKLKFQHYTCSSSMFCKIFWDGKLFACGRAPAIYELCALKDNSSYFDLEHVSDTEAREALKKFYLSEYAECCDYCDFALYPEKWIKGGIQL